MTMHSLGKGLIGAGLAIALLGLICYILPQRSLIGHLPGDLYIKRDQFSFYFPFTTCLLLSLLISVLFRLFR